MEVDKTGIGRTLAGSQVFSALNEIDLRKVVNLTEERNFGVGETIFQEGAPANELFVLREGKVVLQRPLSTPVKPVSRRMTLTLVNSKEIIGWSALVEPYVYTLTAVCLQPVKVLYIDGIKLRSLLGTNHHIGYYLLTELNKVIASRLDDAWQVLMSERLSTIESWVAPTRF